MKGRALSRFLVGVLALVVGSARAHAEAAETLLRARAAFLVDSDSGEVLLEHNADLPLPPASTTKVVTGLLALQSGRLDESLYVSPEAAAAPPSKISLRAGSRMRLEDLVYALLLNSANDAAVVIAEGLAGSTQAFAREMNAMSRLLGARNSHFVNPNGLPDDDHYSSARDLATLFRQAMRNPSFARIVNTRTAEIYPASGRYRRIALKNHNRLLDDYHMHVVGKTGWTRAAKKCFVGAAEFRGREVSFAVLGSTDLWGDIKRLLEFGLGGGVRPEPSRSDVQVADARTGTAGGDEDERPAARAKGRVGSQGKKATPPAKAAKSAGAGKAAKNAGLDYSVRVGSFRDYKSAAQVRSSVARRGFSARVEQQRERRGAVYHVAVGRYSDRGQAQQAARTIQKEHRGLSAVVVAQR